MTKRADLVFRPRSARFVISALGKPPFSHFQQSARVCAKQRFQLEISRFCHFPTGPTGLFERAFSARDQNVLRFLHFAHHFLAIFNKVHEFLQINVFSPRYASFVIFALGAPLLSAFQQRFQPDISTFSHFCSGDTTS